jgi:integrase/recombinase XerC
MMMDGFLQYIQYEKRYSLHTVNAYRKDLEQFQLYLQQQYSITDFTKADFQLIRSWLVHLKQNNAEAVTINRKITTLRSFYKYLLREKLITQSPLLKIASVKKPKRLAVFVEEEKMRNLAENVDFGTDFTAVRDELILELFYATGMRLSELINIKNTDIDFYNNVVKVLGKRNKERMIPLLPELAARMKDFINLKQKQGFEACVYFFVTDKGTKTYQKLVYRIVKKYLSEVSTLDKRSPHVLRHTFATHMLNKGADINSIKEILGHANLSATQVYTHNTIEKLMDVHKLAHPKA